MKRFTVFLVMSALLYGGILTARATEWPQWRGPNRDGVSGEVGILKEWSPNGPKVLWKIPLGEGFFWHLRFSRTGLHHVLRR